MSNLKTMRRRVHLSQRDLARKLNVTQATVSHWEAGKHAPCSKYIQPLAKALRISVAELMENI